MNAQHVPWDHLQYFLATARNGTLVAAAEALGVNHSTVHRRIAALEDELDARLFDRSKQGYELTSAGAELLEHVLAIEREVLAIGRKIVGRDQALAGIVRVATVHDLALRVLMPIIREFRAQHPAVSINLHLATDFADLARRDADIALRFGQTPDDPRVVGRRVAFAASVLSASKQYLREHGRPRSEADLAVHSIVRGDASVSRLPDEAFLDEHVDPKQVVVRTNDMYARLAAVRQNLGIGFVPHFMTADDPEVEHLSFAPIVGANIWMLLHSDMQSNARVRAFADFAYERMTAMRPLFNAGRPPV